MHYHIYDIFPDIFLQKHSFTIESNRYANYFKFRNNFYHQIRELAMGGPLSPLLANIYVEYVETLAIETHFLKPKFWGR